MVRRIARVVDPADVLGAVGFLIFAYGVGLYDWRLPPVLIGAALFVLALARAWHSDVVALRSVEPAADAGRRAA